MVLPGVRMSVGSSRFVSESPRRLDVTLDHTDIDDDTMTDDDKVVLTHCGVT